MTVDLQGLVLLLLFIAPGFLYSRAYLAARPRYRRSPDVFEQTVLAVVGSAFVHALLIGLIGSLVLGILALIYAVREGHAPLVRELFYIPPATAADVPVLVVALYLIVAAIYVTLSMVFARRAGAWFGHSLPKRAPRLYRLLTGSDPPEQEVLLWYSTLFEEPLQHGAKNPRVVAWLRSGERFEGNLVELRLSADEANVIELALENVTLQARTTDPAAPLLHHHVLLRSVDILWLGRIDADVAETAGAT